jgi:signal peptidase I
VGFVTESDPVTDQLPEPVRPGAHRAENGPGQHRAEGSRRRRQASGSKGLGLLRETAIIVVSALVLSWLIKSLLVQAFYIPSPSMHDTLVEGDRVMVSRLVPRVLDIHRGDIVVFKDPGNWLETYVPPDRGPIGNAVVTGLTAVGLMPQDTGEHLIKRVIGTPGDHVSCEGDGAPVVVNGVPLDETSYIRPGEVPSKNAFDEVVPEGMLFVMGDNRGDSADSRAHLGSPGGGFVPIDNVVGTAFATVWPFPHATWHRNPGDVFAQVPAP